MKKILYVEDDSINAFVIERLLRKDFQIVHVPNGEDCLERMRKEVFDCILMDINLGKGNMNGTETMKKVREISSCKDIPIIAVTSYAMAEDKERFINEGFDAYMPKPVERKTLVQCIKTLCK